MTASAAYQQKREVVLCFDLKTGKKLWERQVQATGGTQCHPKTNMAAPTPITDGQRVYALFATGDLVCYDRAGDLVWYRSLVGDYPTVGNNVGMASSPTLHGDTLADLHGKRRRIVRGRHRQADRRQSLAHRKAARHQLGQPGRHPEQAGQAEVVFQGSDGLTLTIRRPARRNGAPPS